AGASPAYTTPARRSVKWLTRWYFVGVRVRVGVLQDGHWERAGAGPGPGQGSERVGVRDGGCDLGQPLYRPDDAVRCHRSTLPNTLLIFVVGRSLVKAEAALILLRHRVLLKALVIDAQPYEALEG